MTAGWRSRTMASPSSRPTSIRTTISPMKIASDGPFPPSAANAAVTGITLRVGSQNQWRIRVMGGALRTAKPWPHLDRRWRTVAEAASRSTIWRRFTSGDCKRPTTQRNLKRFPRNCNCKLFATKYNGLLNGRERKPTHRQQGRWVAAQARPASVGGGIRVSRHPTDGFAGQKARSVSWPRLSGCSRLHGSWQLGDIARRWVQVWIRAAHRRSAFELDGDPAAGFVRAAGDRIGP